MGRDGVELVATDRRSLAYELGFRAGDVIISLNGVPATKPIALRNELMSLSQKSPGLGTLVYRRGTSKRTMRIKIK